MDAGASTKNTAPSSDKAGKGHGTASVATFEARTAAVSSLIWDGIGGGTIVARNGFGTTADAAAVAVIDNVAFRRPLRDTSRPLGNGSGAAMAG